MIKLLLLSLLLVGCGEFRSIGNLTYGPEFEKEVKSYIQMKSLHLGIYDANYITTIEFKILMPPTVGTCNEITRSYPTRKSVQVRAIKIDTINWYLMSDSRREALMFHELGHCDLGLDHITNVPSIMSPRLIDQDIYINYRDDLIEDLFLGIE